MLLLLNRISDRSIELKNSASNCPEETLSADAAAEAVILPPLADNMELQRPISSRNQFQNWRILFFLTVVFFRRVFWLTVPRPQAKLTLGLES
jgi:hypothetical protein